MRCFLGPASVGSHSSWRWLLLTGLVFAACACCVSTEQNSLAQRIETPLFGSTDDSQSVSWGHGTEDTPFYGFEDTTPDTVWSNQDSDGHSMGLEARMEPRVAKAQIGIRASSSKFYLKTTPSAVDGVIQSEAGYSVVLKCQLINSSTAVLKWTLNGQPCQADELLIIRRLAQEHLGTYVCEAKNGTEHFISSPLTLKLLEGEPVNPRDPDPFENYYMKEGAAVAVIVAGVLGSLAMILAAVFFAKQWNRRRNRI